MHELPIQSAFRGITTPINEIYDEITKRGWEPSVKFKKGEGYIATAKNPHGETLETKGKTDATAAGNLLVKIMRHETIRSSHRRKLALWNTSFTNKIEEIAKAYAQAPVYDPKAAIAWKELADDSTRRAEVIREQIKVEVVPDPEPYESSQEMCEDVHKNKHFYVSSANSQHPVWTVKQNVDFRIVHDVLGHCFAPETLVRTEDGYKPIVDIREGDRVLSSNGRFNRVKTVWAKHFEGELVELENRVGASPVRMTPEHEALALTHSHARSHHRAPCSPSNCGRDKRNPERFHDVTWVPAEELTEGSYLATGLLTDTRDLSHVTIPSKHCGPRTVPTEFEIDEEFLWVVGLFLAEGSTDKTKISFGLHIAEGDFHQRVINFFERYGYRTHFAKRPEGDKGVKLEVYGTALARWWREWLGHGCQNKSIPAELMNLPNERLKHVVDGVLDGDGWKTRDGIGQTSPWLARQLVEFGLRTGSMPSTSVNHPNGKKPVYTTFGLRHAERRGGNKRGFWNIHGRTLARNQRVSRTPYSGWVFDLEVEDDPSYVVENVIVHNCVSGGDFGWEGENRACAAHFPLLTPLAQKALFTECIAQTAAAAYYRSFMPQKVAFIDDHIEQAQEVENSPNHQGLHPSQSLVPTEMPALKPSEPQGLWWATQVPSADFSGGLPVFGAERRVTDPNADWTSGVDPLAHNAHLYHRDPLEVHKVRDTAHKIHTGWADMTHPDGSPDLDSMKQAIVNAFRVVLLSPLKNLKWNAIHYQDIAHVPATVTDPKRYWDALESRRENWNQSRGYAPGSHKPHWKEEQTFRQIRRIQIMTENPGWNEAQADEAIDRELLHMRGSIEAQVLKDSKSSRLDMTQVEVKVNNEMKRLLKAITRPEHEEADFAHDQLRLAQQQTLDGEDAGKYGGFIYGHLKSLAQISDHVDEILEAAVTDVQQGGKGHHFRQVVMGLNIPGVGPKVASFAWLLLQPMTSELATIDTHMMDVLDHDYDSEMNNRDYYKFERELAAGRDAAGYGHVPLGQFQWGMWDYKRTGPGTHQDHSAMKVLDPVPHHTVDWAPHLLAPQQDWVAPPWWEDTKEARDAVGRHWDENIATQFPRTRIPKLAYRGWGPVKSFKHWWDKEKKNSKIKVSDARKLAEYAVGEKLSQKQAEKFLKDHKEDVTSYTSFKNKFIEEYKDLKRSRGIYSKRANAGRIPWVFIDGRVLVGKPNESYMNLLRRSLGMSMEEAWGRLPDEGFSMGVYESGRVFAQDDLNDAQLRQVELAVQQPNSGV